MIDLTKLRKWLEKWEEEQYHNIGEPSSVNLSIDSLRGYKIINIKTQNEPKWPLTTTRWMVYGLDKDHEIIIPYGFYICEERANEKREEFIKKNSTNGLVSNFKVHCVEIDW